MREAAFLKQNADKWKEFETMLAQSKRANPDQLADLFVQLTDDLSYARTFYPQSKTTQYLNTLAMRVHQAIYRNKRERSNRFITFWKEELPRVMWDSRREVLYSFIIFTIAAAVGAISAANDATFVRLILGDSYVNMTLENIERGDPMGVYASHGEVGMFAYITFNNIRVSFFAFVAGLLLSFGTGYLLFSNGVMLGSFQYFFYEKGVLLTSVLAIWIHGTLEISAIVIAGGAGLVMGNSILFPKTYTRSESFMRGAKQGLKMVIGLVPIFITAGFLESFVTRHSSVSPVMSGGIIICSLGFVLWYFVLYPRQLYNRSVAEAGNSAAAD